MLCYATEKWEWQYENYGRHIYKMKTGEVTNSSNGGKKTDKRMHAMEC